MQRNNGDMIFKLQHSSALKAKLGQHISNIYIYLYVSDKSGYAVSEITAKRPSYLSKARHISTVNGYLARPQGYKTFLCSTQLSTKFILLINVKITTMLAF